jgi:hypothetical protein
MKCMTIDFSFSLSGLTSQNMQNYLTVWYLVISVTWYNLHIRLDLTFCLLVMAHIIALFAVCQGCHVG